MIFVDWNTLNNIPIFAQTIQEMLLDLRAEYNNNNNNDNNDEREDHLKPLQNRELTTSTQIIAFIHLVD